MDLGMVSIDDAVMNSGEVMDTSQMHL
jgi:hypothetical protein